MNECKQGYEERAMRFQILYPIWIGIIFNLIMTVASLTIPSSTFADWYFEEKGALKIMVSGWLVFIAWSIINCNSYQGG
jgi:hypothetical protein